MTSPFMLVGAAVCVAAWLLIALDIRHQGGRDVAGEWAESGGSDAHATVPEVGNEVEQRGGRVPAAERAS